MKKMIPTRMTLSFFFSITALFVVVLALVPASASAQEVGVLTAQVIPPGNNTCAAAGVSGFTPYIYGDSLHSFEFTVADKSYVAVAASVGDMSVPFSQMTRTVDSSGALRIHADIPSKPIHNGLPILITMLSAKSGSPVCLTSISTTVMPSGKLTIAPPSPAPSPARVSSTVATKTTAKPKPVAPPTAQKPVEKPATTTAGAKGTTTVTTNVLGTTVNVLKDICTGTGANRLWFVLLAIFVAIVMFAIFGHSQIPLALRTQEWTAAAIVMPFLLLFGLWYFVESCRTTPWVPVIATIIALAGLSIAFWEGGTKRVAASPQTVINLPPASRK